MTDDSLYRRIGGNVGLKGRELERYTKYMSVRYPRGLDIMYATGTARGFAAGRPELDLDGKRILNEIDKAFFSKDIDFQPANDKLRQPEIPIKEKEAGFRPNWDNMSLDSRMHELSEIGEAEGYAHDSLKDLPPDVRTKIVEHLGKANYMYSGPRREQEQDSLHTQILG